MDDFELRDMLTPPLRYQAEALEALSVPVVNTNPPSVPALAMAYVPSQPWEELYESEEALQRGTIFRQLDLPFEGRRG